MNARDQVIGGANTPAPELSGAKSTDPTRIARLVEHQRVAALYEQAPQVLIAGLIYCPLFAWALSRDQNLTLVLAWLGVRVGCGLLRLWDIGQFNRAQPQPGEEAAWRRRCLALLTLDVISWAAIGPLFLTTTPGFTESTVLVTIVAVAAIGTMTLYSHLRAVAVFAIGMLLPSIVMLALRGNVSGWIGAAGGVVYLAVLLREAYRARQSWAELQRLRFENAQIAHESRRLMLVAEHTSSTMSRFLATVSHELRTPLNGIMGTTQMLLSQARDEPTREQLDTIARSTRHLRQLVADMVDLSRVEAGQLQIDAQPFQVRQAIEGVFALQQGAARNKALALELEVASGVPTDVMGDIGRAKQVLHNLVGNAIKFTEQGSVHVGVDYAEGLLRFTVRDSGCGVAPERAEAIFAAFDQGQARRNGAGLGLGLTIARELARAMGGDVTLQSQAGPGATFVFTLPAPALSPGATAAQSLQASLAPARLHGRALLVDDNAVNAEVARAMLQRLGMDVDMAADGRAALECLAAQPFDIVLMDCEMPVLDGLEATRQWRAAERGAGQVRRVPIVALTANAVQGDRERCLHAGMDDYLAKPFELAELAEVVQRALPPR